MENKQVKLTKSYENQLFTLKPIFKYNNYKNPCVKSCKKKQLKNHLSSLCLFDNDKCCLSNSGMMLCHNVRSRIENLPLRVPQGHNRIEGRWPLNMQVTNKLDISFTIFDNVLDRITATMA